MHHVPKKVVILIVLAILAAIVIFFPGLRDVYAPSDKSSTPFPEASTGVRGTIEASGKPYQTAFAITKVGDAKPAAIGQSGPDGPGY